MTVTIVTKMTVAKRVVKKSVKAVPVYTEEYVQNLSEVLADARQTIQRIEVAYNQLSMIHSETMLDNVDLRNTIKTLHTSVTLKRWWRSKLWVLRYYWESRE